MKAVTKIDADGFLFAGNRKGKLPIGRTQAWRIIKKAAAETGMSAHISCHSLRKTFGYHAWKSKAPVAVIMDIFNHSSFAITRRYLGVAQDDRDTVYKNISFQGGYGIKKPPPRRRRVRPPK
jgi:integrase